MLGVTDANCTFGFMNLQYGVIQFFLDKLVIPQTVFWHF